LEWLLIASTAVRVNTVYHAIPAASPTSLQHLASSALFVVLLPAAGVMWLEQGHKARYKQLKQRLAGGDAQQQQQQQQQEEESPMHKEVGSSCSAFARMQQVHTKAAAPAGPATPDSSDAVACSSSKPLPHSVLSRRGSSSSTSTSHANIQPISHPVPLACATAAAPQLEDQQQEQQQQQPDSSSHNAGANADSTPTADRLATPLARASSSGLPLRHNISNSSSSSSRPRRRRRKSEPVGSSMNQQLMADIAASLQLAAAVNPAPLAAATAAAPNGKVSGDATTNDMTATAATSPSAAATAAALQASQCTIAYGTTMDAQCMPVDLHSSGIDFSSSNGFLACLEEFAASNKAQSAHTAAAAAAGNSLSNSSSSAGGGCSSLYGLQPRLHALLGQEAAAAVLAAAEAAAHNACGARPGAMPHYTSLAATMPVSVKVRLLLTLRSTCSACSTCELTFIPLAL
jgi:hypothetical protein